jgi:hypothetical protein
MQWFLREILNNLMLELKHHFSESATFIKISIIYEQGAVVYMLSGIIAHYQKLLQTAFRQSKKVLANEL